MKITPFSQKISQQVIDFIMNSDLNLENVPDEFERLLYERVFKALQEIEIENTCSLLKCFQCLKKK